MNKKCHQIKLELNGFVREENYELYRLLTDSLKSIVTGTTEEEVNKTGLIKLHKELEKH